MIRTSTLASFILLSAVGNAMAEEAHCECEKFARNGTTTFTLSGNASSAVFSNTSTPKPAGSDSDNALYTAKYVHASTDCKDSEYTIQGIVHFTGFSYAYGFKYLFDFIGYATAGAYAEGTVEGATVVTSISASATNTNALTFGPIGVPVATTSGEDRKEINKQHPITSRGTNTCGSDITYSTRITTSVVTYLSTSLTGIAFARGSIHVANGAPEVIVWGG